MNRKIFYFAKKSLLLIMAVVSLLSLSFAVVKCEYKNVKIFEDTGFSLLGFKSSILNYLGEFNKVDYWGANAFLGVFSIIHLVYSISAILIAICIFVKKSNSKLSLYILISTSIFTLANFVVGIVFKNLCSNGYDKALSNILLYGTIFVDDIKTQSYIPLIIQCCILIIYFVVIYLEKQSKFSNVAIESCSS